MPANHVIWIRVVNGRILIVPYRRPTKTSDTVEWRCETHPFWITFINTSPLSGGATEVDGTQKTPEYWTSGPQEIVTTELDSYPYTVDLLRRNPERGGEVERLHHGSPDIIVEL